MMILDLIPDWTCSFIARRTGDRATSEKLVFSDTEKAYDPSKVRHNETKELLRQAPLNKKIPGILYGIPTKNINLSLIVSLKTITLRNDRCLCSIFQNPSLIKYLLDAMLNFTQEVEHLTADKRESVGPWTSHSG